MKRLRHFALVLALFVAGGFLAYSSLPPKSLTLTGIVTTNDVVMSSQVAGLVSQLLVSEGDLVKKGQLIATIAPDELRADTIYYTQNAQGLTSQVRERADPAPGSDSYRVPEVPFASFFHASFA